MPPQALNLETAAPSQQKLTARDVTSGSLGATTSDPHRCHPPLARVILSQRKRQNHLPTHSASGAASAHPGSGFPRGPATHSPSLAPAPPAPPLRHRRGPAPPPPPPAARDTRKKGCRGRTRQGRTAGSDSRTKAGRGCIQHPLDSPAGTGKSIRGKGCGRRIPPGRVAPAGGGCLARGTPSRGRGGGGALNSRGRRRWRARPPRGAEYSGCPLRF
jgi:hypothetical protein